MSNIAVAVLGVIGNIAYFEYRTRKETSKDLLKQRLADFVKLQKNKSDSANSWSINVADIDQKTFDLSAKNPNKGGGMALRTPKEISQEMVG